jgi:CRISPR-associated endoribonuclease Cas6
MLNFWEADYSSKLIQGIVDDSEVMYGIEVEEVRIGKTPTFENPQKFKVASPVLIRKNVDPQKRQHLTYKDSDVDDYLSRTVITKLKEIGESKPDISIKFDRNYPNPKTKLVDIKGSKLRTNLCPVIITGDLKHIEFAWTVGIGELTGSGFGALY